MSIYIEFIHQAITGNVKTEGSFWNGNGLWYWNINESWDASVHWPAFLSPGGHIRDFQRWRAGYHNGHFGE